MPAYAEPPARPGGSFFEKLMYKIIKNITFGNVFIVDSLEDFVGEGKGTEKVLTF